MDIKKLSGDKYKATFLIKGTTPSFINTFRRMVINKVPTMAIAKVKILENTSGLYDDAIAHRLGLIPLKTDLHSYFIKADCKCKGKGCPRCELHLTLNAQGPCTVYAESLVSKDPKIKPVYGKMPIVKLLDNQKLKLEATAILGVGKEHTKFSPALIYFHSLPNFTVHSINDPKKIENIIQQCPKKILESKGNTISIKDPLQCNLCKACEDLSEGAIKVESSKTDFILNIESWGQLTIKEIVAASVAEMNKQLNELSKHLKKIK